MNELEMFFETHCKLFGVQRYVYIDTQTKTTFYGRLTRQQGTDED